MKNLNFEHLDAAGFRDVIGNTRINIKEYDGETHLTDCECPEYATERYDVLAAKVWGDIHPDCREGLVDEIVSLNSVASTLLKVLPELETYARFPPEDAVDIAVHDLLNIRLYLHQRLAGTRIVQTVIAELDNTLERLGQPRSVVVQTLLTQLAARCSDVSDDRLALLTLDNADAKYSSGEPAAQLIAATFVPGETNAVLLPWYAADHIARELCERTSAPRQTNVVPCESTALAQRALMFHKQGGAFADLRVAVDTARDAFA